MNPPINRYRSLRRVAAPVVEPITLAEAKKHCRIDLEIDDALLAGYIATAREMAEDYLDRSLVLQQWSMQMDQFPWEIELPRPPMATADGYADVSITYLLTNGTERVTLPTANYRVDRDSTPGVIRNLYGRTWPSHLFDQNSVRVTWWAGYSDLRQIPQRAKTAMLMIVAELYEKRGAAEIPSGAKALLDSVSWGSYT